MNKPVVADTVTLRHGQETYELPMGEQYSPELGWLMNMVKARELHSVLEIGSRRGYTLHMLAIACGPGSKARSIDIASKTNDELRATIVRMQAMGFDADVLIADSNTDEALAWANKNGPYDLVFIDGDHEYAGARNDWLRYRHLAKHVVALHDVGHPRHGVRKLWDEIKAAGFYRLEENIDSRGSFEDPLGIGVVHVKRPAFPGDAAFMIGKISDAMLGELRGIVQFFFCRPVSYYADMSTEEYRALVRTAQDEINNRNIPVRVLEELRNLPRGVLATDAVMVQTCRLRAVRPHISKAQEYLDWHRESFYGGEESVNVWVPIANVSADTAVQYIRGSELIPDEDIKTIDEMEEGVKDEHCNIGIVKSVRRIVDGVDLTDRYPLVVVPGEVALFNGALIHGGGQNSSDQIRFSIDYRIVAQESLTRRVKAEGIIHPWEEEAA